MTAWQQLLTVDPYGRRFPDLVEILEASSGFEASAILMSHPGLTRIDRARLGRIDESLCHKAARNGVQAHPMARLGVDWRAIGAPPACFVWGQLGAAAKRAAIVGTRTASTYGKAASRKFAEKLSRAGICVVSGGAFGIDANAHEGALEAGGTTWAVFGTGVDKPYPASNQGLFERIRQSGALISQFPLGTASFPNNFVARNHTIAALSDVIIVIEAPEGSGALHTARAAAEMGKDVFVVPGPITLESFRGSHALIRDGATLVDHPDQVLEALGVEPLTSGPAVEVEGPAAQILGALGDGPLRLEALELQTGMEPADLLSELTMMELEGLVRQAPEGYVKI